MRWRPPLWLILAAALLVVGVLPWLLALTGQGGEVWRLSYRYLCHQAPERTLWLDGAPMVVCSRCAGIHLGVALGALLALPRRALRFGRGLVVAAVAVNLLEAIAELSGMPPLHGLRIACGLTFGWAASAFLVAALRAPYAPVSSSLTAQSFFCASRSRAAREG